LLQLSQNISLRNRQCPRESEICYNFTENETVDYIDGERKGAQKSLTATGCTTTYNDDGYR
jgi:hypothetical protein